MENYLQVQRGKASKEDDVEAKRLHEQGLLIKAEYPRGRSHLEVDTRYLNSLGNFGYGSHLIVASELMAAN